MLKNLSLMITQRCNSRCQMCQIWKRDGPELSPTEFEKLFSRPEFSQIEDLSITGGEPTLRADLLTLSEAIVSRLPRLRMLFLCSNGADPESALRFVTTFSSRIEQVFLATSIEGQPDIHRRIRGIDSYEQAVAMVRHCRQACPGLRTILSMTLTKHNCLPEQIEHVRDLALATGSTYTFKPVIASSAYFNSQSCDLAPSADQIRLVLPYVDALCDQDPFMRVQAEYLRSGRVPLLQDAQGKVSCLAGDVFAFMTPNGDIYPCCLSSRKIGDTQRGLTDNPVVDLGRSEPCPCCQEMCIYPQLNWSQFASWKQV